MVTEIATIAAIVLGPIFAVEAQRILDMRRERKSRREALFRTFMASRVTRAADSRHTEGLNLIGVEFYGEKAVVTVWREYMAHLNSGPITDPWVQKFNDLFVELLYAMAQSLGYKDLDKTDLRQAYAPKLLENLDKENADLRKGVLAVLAGRVSIPIHVAPPPGAPPEVPSAAIPSPPMATALPPYPVKLKPGEKL
jgi:hypothetical protein